MEEDEGVERVGWSEVGGKVVRVLEWGREEEREIGEEGRERDGNGGVWGVRVRVLVFFEKSAVASGAEEVVGGE